ncbi:type II toxin-antitoxin system VapC family toxin [Agromyces sp. NPDC058484]|uniref:type II toxin-antitoxin system VapC family toxin n=1 Tax=Agromyces sp. NPDC058484 TaxID=3346524 RepID=UPI00365815D0
MRLLLDTHALLWALAVPDRLSTSARRHIADRANELVVSAASAWEIGTKVRIGRLPHAVPLVKNYTRLVGQLGATALPMHQEHALFAGTLDWNHRDPFDRMLAAQAVLENATLVTIDPVFGAMKAVRTLW